MFDDVVPPEKRSRATTMQYYRSTSGPPPATKGRIMEDTALLRLLIRSQREINFGDPGTLPPPLCTSPMCPYSTGCLHGQRARLVRRLLEIENALYGKF